VVAKLAEMDMVVADLESGPCKHSMPASSWKSTQEKLQARSAL
jgi:hypothetical protein